MKYLMTLSKEPQVEELVMNISAILFQQIQGQHIQPYIATQLNFHHVTLTLPSNTHLETLLFSASRRQARTAMCDTIC